MRNCGVGLCGFGFGSIVVSYENGFEYLLFIQGWEILDHIMEDILF
jgi:hypothetical protein